MKRYSRRLSLLAVLASALLLSACSSTAPQTTQTDQQFAGIVSGSGTSLTLNGQRLNLSSASITQDDDAANASALQPGVELEAKGRSNGSEFEASSVDVRTRVKGQVDKVSADSLEVVGVLVSVDAKTIIVNRNADGTRSTIAFADLQAGDYLEVYGVPRDDDSVLATRLERKTEDNPDKVELRVKAREVDTTNKTFTYGLKTLTVDYSQAEMRGELGNNAFIRVKGVRDGDVIRAERLRNDRGKREDNSNSSDNIELKGAISNLDESAKTFSILGFTVDYSKAREIKGTLANDAWVKVEGSVDSAGTTIVAREIKVRADWNDNGEDEHGDDHGGHGNDDNGGVNGEQELTATVSSFDATATTFMLGSTKVTVQSSTEYKDTANENISWSEFWGTDRTGALVKVEGTKQEGTLVARQVKLR